MRRPNEEIWPDMVGNSQEQWDVVYASREVEDLGWYEETPARCLDLIARSGLSKDEPILDVGVGTSTLVDALLDDGYTNIIGVDISTVALEKLGRRVSADGMDRVRLIVDDVINPTAMLDLRPVSLWHDRALLHFLLEDHETQAYVDTLRAMVREGGFVVIAAFNLIGAKMCTGMNVKNYDHEMISDLLGEDFTMLDHFDHMHTTPGGAPRPYLYTFSRRTGVGGR
jgi:SAM-dependent methyltransferase